MNKEFDLIVKLCKGEIQDLNLHSVYRKELNTLEDMLDNEHEKGYNQGLTDCASRIIKELRSLQSVGRLHMTLDGLAAEFGVEENG